MGKEITKKRKYLFITVWIISLIFLSYIAFLTTYKKEKRFSLTEYPEIVFQHHKLEPVPLEILPPEYESFVQNNSFSPTSDDLNMFLNNGYMIRILNNDVADFREAYNNISRDNKEIYLSSNTISRYVESEYQQIRNRKQRRRRTGELNNKDSQLVIEKEELEYKYIKTKLEYISNYFPKLKDLKEKVEEIIKYTNGDKEKSKELVSIIDNLPVVELQDDEIFAQVIKYQGNNIFTYPEIIERSEIPIINKENFESDYDVSPIPQVTGSVRIPVLMFHQIGYPPEGSSPFKSGLYTSPEIFEKQVAYLTKKNYRCIDSKEFTEILNSGKNPSQKTVMLTFDDAVESHYTVAYPILKKYNQKGVFFVPSGRSSISVEQLREMSDNGMDIQSHTVTHPDLTKIVDQDILNNEILGSRIGLESVTKKNVIAIAYPGCVANTPTYNTVSSSGYSLGFSCGRSIDHFSYKRLSISRLHVPNSLEGFKNILSGIN